MNMRAAETVLRRCSEPGCRDYCRVNVADAVATPICEYHTKQLEKELKRAAKQAREDAKRRAAKLAKRRPLPEVKPQTRVCANPDCGKTFQITRRGCFAKKFCTEACRMAQEKPRLSHKRTVERAERAALSLQVERACSECAKPFRSERRNAVCCSPECQDKRKQRQSNKDKKSTPLVVRHCVICARPITEKWGGTGISGLCSDDCRKKYNDRRALGF